MPSIGILFRFSVRRCALFDLPAVVIGHAVIYWLRIFHCVICIVPQNTKLRSLNVEFTPFDKVSYVQVLAHLFRRGII